MGEPFIGEVKLVAFNFAPKGWATCDGQLLPINQNQALFSLLGTNYGGDGRTTFGLPNLQGRVAVHQSGGYTPGQVGGEETHTLIGQEMPTPHNHASQGTSAAATSFLPQGFVLANANLNAYAAPNPLQPIAPGSVTTTGGQPHPNMSPYSVVLACVALVGIFPSRN